MNPETRLKISRAIIEKAVDLTESKAGADSREYVKGMGGGYNEAQIIGYEEVERPDGTDPRYKEEEFAPVLENVDEIVADAATTIYSAHERGTMVTLLEDIIDEKGEVREGAEANPFGKIDSLSGLWFADTHFPLFDEDNQRIMNVDHKNARWIEDKLMRSILKKHPLGTDPATGEPLPWWKVMPILRLDATNVFLEELEKVGMQLMNKNADVIEIVHGGDVTHDSPTLLNMIYGIKECEQFRNRLAEDLFPGQKDLQRKVKTGYITGNHDANARLGAPVSSVAETTGMQIYYQEVGSDKLLVSLNTNIIDPLWLKWFDKAREVGLAGEDDVFVLNVAKTLQEKVLKMAKEFKGKILIRCHEDLVLQGTHPFSSGQWQAEAIKVQEAHLHNHQIVSEVVETPDGREIKVEKYRAGATLFTPGSITPPTAFTYEMGPNGISVREVVFDANEFWQKMIDEAMKKSLYRDNSDLLRAKLITDLEQAIRPDK